MKYLGKRNPLRHYIRNNHCPDCNKPVTNYAIRCIKCEGIKKRKIVGPKNFSKGKLCIDCKKKISNRANKCRSCSKNGSIRLDMRGENNPKWNGGWFPYYGSNWNSQKRKRFELDNRSCWVCGSVEKQLNIHHQIPFTKCSNYIEANNLNNLVTLCQKHHVLAEKQNILLIS